MNSIYSRNQLFAVGTPRHELQPNHEPTSGAEIHDDCDRPATGREPPLLSSSQCEFRTLLQPSTYAYDLLICLQLVSRGKVHIFKYLEIQAIKEDRKRGVLTDSEYRRSYRKTTSGQLTDIR